MKTGIKRAILETLIFYDIFDFPLTNQEIFDNLLYIKCETHQLLDELDDLLSDNMIGFDQAFYYLAGREKIVNIRKTRYIESYNKWQLIKKYRWLFTLAPFVKMVGLANTLAYGNAKKDGDIDLLIVVRRKRMFAARLILTGLALMVDMWRFNGRIKNRFCLSFYLSEDNLDLSRLKLSHDDIYLAYWTKWLKPVYCDDMKTAERYWRKNSWIGYYFPNTIFKNLVFRLDKKSLFKEYFENLLAGKPGDWLERILMKIQLNKIKQKTPEFDRDGVMADSDILKFHPSGVRNKYYKIWRKKIELIIE